MKKIGIGTVALGAGILLVLGGAGSTAYWQTTQQAPAIELRTGALDLNLVGERWSVNGALIEPSEGDSARPDVEALQLVPGTSIRWEQEFFLDRSGTDLNLELELDLGDILPVDVTDSQIPFDFQIGYLNHNLDGDVNRDIFFDDWDHAITPVEGSGHFTVAVIITWPFGDAATDPAETVNRSLNFAETTLTARQIPLEN